MFNSKKLIIYSYSVFVIIFIQASEGPPRVTFCSPVPRLERQLTPVVSYWPIGVEGKVQSESTDIESEAHVVPRSGFRRSAPVRSILKRPAPESSDEKESKKQKKESSAFNLLMDDIGSGYVRSVARSIKDNDPLLSQKNSYGQTPLLWAIALTPSKQRCVMVRLLLGKGAGPNESGNLGFTPLMKAAFLGHRDIVATLLEIPGLQVNRTGDCDCTALQLALTSYRGCQEWVRSENYEHILDTLFDNDKVRVTDHFENQYCKSQFYLDSNRTIDFRRLLRVCCPTP